MGEPAKYTRYCKLSIKKAPVIFKKILHCTVLISGGFTTKPGNREYLRLMQHILNGNGKNISEW